MFSFNSPYRYAVRRPAPWRSAIALFVVLFLSATLLFTGCKTDDNPGALDGTWAYISESNPEWNYNVVINTSNMNIVYEGSYEGQIVNSPDFDMANGVLIIKFTNVISEWDDPSNVGKFGAMYWNDLTATSVKLADAFIGWDRTLFTTQPLAEEAFTPAADKVGNYVDWSITSPYIKQ